MKYIIIVLLLIPVTTFCQNSADKNYSAWNSIVLDHAINNKLSIKNEIHIRRTGFLKNWQQLLIRPSVHYKLNKGVDFSAGYSFSKNYRILYDFDENNVWEQVLLSHSFNKSKFKHRFRFEQRFIDQFFQAPDSRNFKKGATDYKMRFRYRFTWGIPVIEVIDNRKVKIVMFDEIWLNTDSGIVPKSLNQNWFYAGLSYPLLKNVSLGFGYMNDYRHTGVNHYTSNQILQTTLKYHI